MTCGKPILPMTARMYGGMCVPCHRKQHQPKPTNNSEPPSVAAEQNAIPDREANLKCREPELHSESVLTPPQATQPPTSDGEAPGIQLEYHDMDWFERRERELSKHKRTNRDAATDAAASFHQLHQDDATHESGLDPDTLTDMEREKLRYNGGADSQYWNAE